MAKIEYLDDFDSFIQEIAELGSELEIRMQGRGRGVRKRPDGPPFVEATVVLTHLDTRTNVIREAISFVGEAPTSEKEDVEFLRICMTSRMEDLGDTLQAKGCVVKKGRWVS
jgi:hypothetical protein